MRRCPRCRTTMILTVGDTHDAYSHLWKCLGCAMEIYRDSARQEADEQLRESIALSGSPRPLSAR